MTDRIPTEIGPRRHRPISHPTAHHDVVVVGAGRAGAATAMLLARAGADVVLVVQRSFIDDPLAGHTLEAGGVDQLDRWGLLDHVTASTPPIRRSVFEFGDEPVDCLGTGGDPGRPSRPLFAPRPTVLGPILVDAARRAGAVVDDGHVTHLLRDAAGRVCGVSIDDDAGGRREIATEVVIGADGARSIVVRQLDVPVVHEARRGVAGLFAYVRGTHLEPDERHIAFGDRLIGGSIPTNDGIHIAFAGMSPLDLRGVQLDAGAALIRTLGRVSPSLGTAVRAGTVIGPIRSVPGWPDVVRSARGPGWALVGEAAAPTNPVLTYGVDDELRDAELLSDAVASGDLDGYERVRDTFAMQRLDHADWLASFEWAPSDAADVCARLGDAAAGERRPLDDHRRGVDGASR